MNGFSHRMLNSGESPIEVAPVDFIEMGRDTNSRVDQAAVERSWRERGFSCGLWNHRLPSSRSQ